MKIIIIIFLNEYIPLCYFDVRKFFLIFLLHFVCILENNYVFKNIILIDLETRAFQLYLIIVYVGIYRKKRFDFPFIKIRFSW